MDVPHFYYVLPKSEMWRLYAEFRDRTVFIDIETTGLTFNSSNITIVGVLDYTEYRAFARHESMDERQTAFEMTP